MKITYQESDKAFYQEMESFLRTDCYSYMHLFKIWSKAIRFANNHKSESIAKSFESFCMTQGHHYRFEAEAFAVETYMRNAYATGFEAGRSIPTKSQESFENWWATEPFGFDHPETRKGILELMASAEKKGFEAGLKQGREV